MAQIRLTTEPSLVAGCTRIGVVTKERELLLREESGLTPLPSGFEHFR